MPYLWHHLIGAIYSSKCMGKKFLESFSNHFKLLLLFSFDQGICILAVSATMFSFMNAFCFSDQIFIQG